MAHYEGSKTDYRAALDYRFLPEMMVYGSLSTGFKGGGTNPRPFYNDQVISFNPETLTNFELGIKSDLLDRHLRLNLALVYSKIKAVQVPVLACPESPCAARVNAGDAESKGVELEAEARPTDAFSIDASYSNLNFHFTSLLPAAEYPTNPARATLDDPTAGVPKQKFTLGMQYQFALGNAGSVTPRLNISYQDMIYTGYPSVERSVRTLLCLPSYTMSNARLTWRNAKNDVDVSFKCTNLTDEYYYLSNFDVTGLGAGFDKVQPGRPREWVLTVKKEVRRELMARNAG